MALPRLQKRKMWFRKKQLESEEYLKLLHKFAELSTEVEILTSQINIIGSRKWGADRKKIEELTKKDKTENLKTTDGLDLLRGLDKENV